jgi:hypothetical protein
MPLTAALVHGLLGAARLMLTRPPASVIANSSPGAWVTAPPCAAIVKPRALVPAGSWIAAPLLAPPVERSMV